MKFSTLLLGAALTLGSVAHAQDLPAPAQDPLADLPPIGMALEVAKLCGAKPNRFPELVKFKRLAVQSYVQLRQGKASDVEEAFKKGEVEGRKLKADMNPQRCAAALTEMKQLNDVFVHTNQTIEKLMQFMGDAQAKTEGAAPANATPAPAKAAAKK